MEAPVTCEGEQKIRPVEKPVRMRRVDADVGNDIVG